jgi:hypothetical protein
MIIYNNLKKFRSILHKNKEQHDNRAAASFSPIFYTPDDSQLG